MLKTRIVPAIVLAAAVSLGTAGCGFIVPQATTYEYAPSDGINVDLPNVDVRNLMLVVGDKEANIVFTGVNDTDSPVRVSIKFVEDGKAVAQSNVTVAPGLTPFGTDEPILVTIPGIMAGSMVTAFIESDGIEIEREVPVLDGTLAEYAELVP